MYNICPRAGVPGLPPTHPSLSWFSAPLRHLSRAFEAHGTPLGVFFFTRQPCFAQGDPIWGSFGGLRYHFGTPWCTVGGFWLPFGPLGCLLAPDWVDQASSVWPLRCLCCFICTTLSRLRCFLHPAAFLLYIYIYITKSYIYIYI